MNNKQFKAKLNSFAKGDLKATEVGQILADYAVLQAGHANLSAMADLLNQVKSMRNIDTTAMNAYMFASVTGVQWHQPMKDGKAVGSRTIRQKKDATIETHSLKVSWVEFAKEVGETKVTALPKVSGDSRKAKLATYRAKAKATTNAVALDNQLALLKAQVAILESQIKKVNK